VIPWADVEANNEGRTSK